MNEISEHFQSDLAAIKKHWHHLVALAQAGDPAKIVEFPHEPLLEKALGYDSIRFYMFDEYLRLVMHILGMHRLNAEEELLPLADRFALTGEDSLSSTKEFIKVSHRRLLVAEPKVYESIFSTFVFGGPHLMGWFELGTTGAVAFALQLSDWNTLDYNDYMLDISLDI